MVPPGRWARGRTAHRDARVRLAGGGTLARGGPPQACRLPAAHRHQSGRHRSPRPSPGPRPGSGGGPVSRRRARPHRCARSSLRLRHQDSRRPRGGHRRVV
eukprot:11912654-Alexandrium_andersonii.AAC.1